MVKKEVIIGLLIGLFTNLIGISLFFIIVGKIKNLSFMNTFSFYSDNGILWMPLALGALPNLLVFFWFLKINNEYRARGILIATFITAIIAYLIYFL